ncbi:MAG: cell wall hydrolase [Clostridia bacterium]|nr:cell wall hydrolase [Clostridia bacterium]
MRKFTCIVITLASLVFSTTSALAEKVLKLGAEDSEITKIQHELTQQGYITYDDDGYFGLTTLAAIIKFQEDKNIYVSGTINNETRIYLYNNEHNNNLYSEEDLYWLARIVYAESRGESYEGKLAVANCVLNRVKSKIYPNTVKEVIFDQKHGVQFQPVSNGTIYNTPDSESLKAAKEAIEGKNIIGNCLFFFNPEISTNSWISQNRNYYTTIGKHSFYL